MKKDITLYHYIEKNDFDRMDLIHNSKTVEFYLPTEIVIEEPGIVTPMIARGYLTRLYLDRGEILSYEKLFNKYGNGWFNWARTGEVYTVMNL